MRACVCARVRVDARARICGPCGLVRRPLASDLRHGRARPMHALPSLVEPGGHSTEGRQPVRYLLLRMERETHPKHSPELPILSLERRDALVPERKHDGRRGTLVGRLRQQLLGVRGEILRLRAKPPVGTLGTCPQPEAHKCSIPRRRQRMPCRLRVLRVERYI